MHFLRKGTIVSHLFHFFFPGTVPIPFFSLFFARYSSGRYFFILQIFYLLFFYVFIVRFTR